MLRSHTRREPDFLAERKPFLPIQIVAPLNDKASSWVVTSLLPFVIPVELAIVLSALVQPATNIGQLISTGGAKEAFRSTWAILLALIPSVALGAWFLNELEGNSHLLILGLTLICFSIYSISGFAISISKGRQNLAGSITGFVAGLIGVLTSINGMFFIMYLVGIGADRIEKHFARQSLCFLSYQDC